jgi:predicted dehydrogenase
MAQRELPFTCRWALLSLSSIVNVFADDILLSRPLSNPIYYKISCISITGGEYKAKSWIAEHKITDPQNITIYDSWQEMLQKGDFDILYISTPHTAL